MPRPAQAGGGVGVTDQATYSGMYEPSAAVWLGDGWFVVASDDSNRLRRYRLGVTDKADLIDLVGFTGFTASDLEGSARVGDRVYWISSHSLTTKGREDKDARKVFVGTRIVESANGPWLEPVGQPVFNLRPALLKATGATADTLNIEGLAAGPKGGLLVGLRAPVPEDKALLLPLLNPAEVLHGAEPDFARLIRLDLGKRGVRSMTLLADGRYAIMAGPAIDGNAMFHLFLWDGLSETVHRVRTPDLTGWRPEAMFQLPTGQVMVLSDDGDIGKPLGLKDGDAALVPERRQFRSMVIELR